MGYRLREFWRAGNEQRIEMLHRYGVGAIVVKKHLIAPGDEDSTNLGVYPPDFVSEIQNDDRFAREFENNDVVIYRIPSASKAGQ